MTSIPNLFSVATKELSQDAFITWLLQWSDPGFKQSNPLLHDCGKELLQKMIDASIELDIRTIVSVDAGRQWENVDIWVEVFFRDGRKLLIIIEDKINSIEHSNQLKRYREKAIAYCKKEGFLLQCVYLKTGGEPAASLISITARGFKVVSRKELLQCLKPFLGRGNHILDEFVNHLVAVEQAHQSFLTLTPSKWQGAAWVGFFQMLENKVENIKWHWVHNPNGGFWNMCLTWKGWHDFPVYIQIEQHKICFKIALDGSETGIDESLTNVTAVQKFIYNKLHNFSIDGIADIIKKPSRISYIGKFRTLGVIEPENWLMETNALVDVDRVVVRIKEVISYYAEFINHMSAFSYDDAEVEVVYLED